MIGVGGACAGGIITANKKFGQSSKHPKQEAKMALRKRKMQWRM